MSTYHQEELDGIETIIDFSLLLSMLLSPVLLGSLFYQQTSHGQRRI